MKSKILDVVDFEKANALLEGFNKSTGFVTAILDLDGNILSQSGWRQICTDFHRKDPQTASNCTVSDTILSNKMRAGEKYHFYTCMNGLIDVAVPIIIRGEHIANLFSGQFFFEKPDISFFKEQAQKYGFEEKAYLEALEKVPVLSKEKVETAMDFLLGITRLIMEMTAEKIEQININEAIEKSAAALSQNQTQLKQHLKDLTESQRIAQVGTWRLDLATDQVVWSEELYKMYGFDPTIPPPPYTEHMKLFIPESWERLSAALQQTREAGIPYELELKTVTKDGSNGWMWSRGEAETDSKGKISTIWGAAQDITRYKKIEHEIKQSEERYKCLFEYSGVGIGYYTTDGIVISYNQKALENIGGKPEDYVGKSFKALFPEQEAEKYYKRIEEAILCDQPKEYEDYLVLNSIPKWFASTFSKVTNSFGEVIGVQIASLDITERKQSEEKIQQQHELLASLLKLLPVGVFMVDAADGKPLIVNDMGKTLLGSGILPDANEHNLSEIYKAYKKDTLEHYPTDQMPIVLGMKGISSHIEDMVIERQDGEKILLEVFGTPVKDNQGKPWASLVTFMDITQRKKAESELIYLSYHDHLTGFYNRRFFEEELNKLDTEANLPLSVIICDINGLKLINDSFGHNYGDQLIVEAAKAIKAACPADGMMSRIGGDEFAVLLRKTDAAKAAEIGATIKELASKENVQNVELSISFGHDTKVNDKQKILEVLANAENHMYRHKLYERSSTRSKTIEVIMSTLFEKSNRESMHSARVSSMCKDIASKMDYGKDDVNKIRIAGLVHDIGKIGIDERILNKDGNLSNDEREQIKRHPEIGWRILSSANEFSELAQFILHHHERWDGTGYPNGLKGKEIALEARIIAVADAYDAMTSERSYRPAINQQEAIKELKRCAGTQFDPEIIKVLVDQVLTYNLFG